MKEEPKKMLAISIPLELHQELTKQAEQTSRSLSSYIRQVLKFHLMYLDQFKKR